MQAVSENTSSDPVSRPRRGSTGEKWEETCHCIYPLAWHRAVWPGCCEGRRGGDIYHRHRPERTQTEKISFRDNRQKRCRDQRQQICMEENFLSPLYHCAPPLPSPSLWRFPHTHTHTPSRSQIGIASTLPSSAANPVWQTGEGGEKNRGEGPKG